MKVACMYFNAGRNDQEVELVDISDDKDLHEAEVEELERRNCYLKDGASVREIERALGHKIDYGPRDWQDVDSFFVDPAVVDRLRKIELPERRDGGRWPGVRFAIYDAFRI